MNDVLHNTHPNNLSQQLAPVSCSAIAFSIGDRIYWVGRDERQHGYRIVANGDVVEYASAHHYGEVGAFVRIAKRLREIEVDTYGIPKDKES